MIRKILLPVRGDGKGDNVFAHAATLAVRYKGHVVVAHCRPRAEDLMPYGIAISAPLRKLLLSQSANVADQVEDGMRKELESLAARFGITLSDKAIPGVATTAWIEEQGRQVDVIKRHGRLADLICVAKPDVDRNLGTNTLKAALFNTGRPVMMCPPLDSAPERLCDHVAIGWNGSVEASRAVAMTLGVLEEASEVTVLSTGAEVNGADSESLKEYLQARGVNVKLLRFKSSRKIGRDLLQHCAQVGADTLIMGAYSNSHETETVFGGATQYVVDHSGIPVILVH
ncbi:MAG: universal stress protein [Granulosicoccus sp.]|nr:universal stress protein [Granulosicoccus sp.]